MQSFGNLTIRKSKICNQILTTFLIYLTSKTTRKLKSSDRSRKRWMIVNSNTNRLKEQSRELHKYNKLLPKTRT